MKGKKKIIDKGIKSSTSSTARLKKIQYYLHVNNNHNNDKFQRSNSLYNNCIATHSRSSASNGLIKGNTMTHLYNHNKQNKSSNINVYKSEFGLVNKQQCDHKRVNSFNNVPINTNPNTLLLTIPIRHEHYNTQQYNTNNNNKNKTKQISFNYNIRDVCSSLKDKTTQTHNHAIIEPEHVSYFPTEISNINSIPCSKQTQQTPNDNNSYCETTETHMLANMLTIQDNNNNNNINNTKQHKDPTLNMQSILTKTFNILHKQPQHHKSRNAFSTENNNDSNNNNNNKEQSIHSKRNFTFGEISIIPHKTTNQNTQTKNSIIDTLWPTEQQPLPNYHPTPKPILYYNIKHNYYTINSFKIREAHFKKISNTKHSNNINLNIKHPKKYCRTIATTSPLNREYCYKCKQTQSQHKTLNNIIPRVLPKQP